MSTGKISGGSYGYLSILAAVGGRASGCLVRSASITLSTVLVHRSASCSMPLVSRSVIQVTAVCSFPWRTRIWYVLSLFSLDSYLRAATICYLYIIYFEFAFKRKLTSLYFVDTHFQACTAHIHQLHHQYSHVFYISHLIFPSLEGLSHNLHVGR